MNAFAYAPPRDIKSKIERLMTQAKRARPSLLSFEAPTLSICFDDFPHTAATTGAAILERHNVRGTFYASASASLPDAQSPCGPGFTREDLLRLAENGHEIGCHSFSHLDCARTGVFDVLQDIARNRDALRALGHTASQTSFAYPFGETNYSLKETLPPRFSCARGIKPGINAGVVDLAQLRAFPLYGASGVQRAQRALKSAQKQQAWLIAFTHDVTDAPSPYGTRPADLEDFILEAERLGFQILPVSQALARAEIAP